MKHQVTKENLQGSATIAASQPRKSSEFKFLSMRIDGGEIIYSVTTLRTGVNRFDSLDDAIMAYNEYDETL